MAIPFQGLPQAVFETYERIFPKSFTQTPVGTAPRRDALNRGGRRDERPVLANETRDRQGKGSQARGLAGAEIQGTGFAAPREGTLENLADEIRRQADSGIDVEP